MGRITAAGRRGAAGLAMLASVAGCETGGAGGDGSSLRVAARAAQGGDFVTAAALYRTAFEEDPRSSEALVGLGRAYGGLGQHARAEQALAAAAARRPNDPAVLVELARVQLGAGRAAAAIATLDRAGGRAAREVGVAVTRGVALDRLSRHAEAQAEYRRGLGLDPTNFALLSNLALSLGLSGRAEQGIVILRDLVRDPAADPRTRGNLALVYGLAGREREARATLAADLPADEIAANIAYYRELRGLLAQGKAAAALP